MKAIIFALLVVSSVASAQSLDVGNVGTRAVSTFTDGTRVESVTILAANPYMVFFYQIKQADGTNCYAANVPSAASYMTNLSISCVK